MSGIKAKSVVKYVLLPGIIPRLKALLASGFGSIAFLMAQIYYMVRLLPPGHAYLNPQNMGRFGIRHVIAETANHLVISKKNLDQILVFILMLTGIVLLAAQLALLAFSLIFAPVWAAPGPSPPNFSFFVTQDPTFDIAFMLLDQVFGVGNGTNNFFNSCVSRSISCDPSGQVPAPAVAGFPWPFHLALQNMFRFYSIGILLIGTIIFLYFVVVVLVETATTGTPFGQRFQNVWVPIRLVVAVGLLIPLGFGYNSAQYITFAAAKYGSGLASNAWAIYNKTVSNSMQGANGTGGGNPTGEEENLIAFSKPPDASVISEALSIVHSCAFSYYLHDPNIERNTTTPSTDKIVVDFPTSSGTVTNYQTNQYAVKPYFVKNPQTWQVSQGGLAAESFLEIDANTTYQDALQFYTGGDIIVRFGRRGPDVGKNYAEHPGEVEPTCGDIRVPVIDRREIDQNNMHVPQSAEVDAGYLGAAGVQRMYFEVVKELWFPTGFGTNQQYIDFAGRVGLLKTNAYSSMSEYSPCAMGCTPANALLPSCSDVAPAPNSDKKMCHVIFPSSRWKQKVTNDLQVTLNDNLITIWQEYNAGTNEFDFDNKLLQYGWGGAGIWFNKLAQINGAFITAIMNIPTMDAYPKIMQDVASQKKSKTTDASGLEMYNPAALKGKGVELTSKYGLYGKAKAGTLYSVLEYWNKDSKNMANAEKTLTAGALETGMNLVFGTYGLFAMTDENANIHPLSQLVALGKGLVESAVRNVAGATMSAALGGIASASGIAGGGLANAFAGMLSSTAFVGLTAGFVLFYVLPFLPFVYFYFAVASWVKTIFEAMVGVPLWALAHLRLDGEGLSGESAINGYFLIFEVFLRPILSIFGLVAALVIFVAQVRILNFIWPLVTDNVGGHNSNPTIGIPSVLEFKRSIVDEFFYTVIYAIVVYMLATASFKLIDKIPDNILRWMGQGVSSFGDINQDPTENLTRYAALSGMTAGQEVAGGVQKLGGSLGSGLGSLTRGPR